MADKNYRIVVLNRGWVLVGEYVHKGDMREFTGASAVVRRWGTGSDGLGSLHSGPRDATQLDKNPSGVSWHYGQEVLTIPVDAEVWAKALGNSQ